jgi:hypothetical protein
MAVANSNIQVADLDFNLIKNNLKTYLQSQSVFKDYNFEGSALSTLLDVLAYNTQYNAFYLNMVANEMFLDSAILRPSVVSHAKLMNYVPLSPVGGIASVDLTFSSSNTSLTLPQYTNFLSGAINGVNYRYVTMNSITVPVVAGVATFSGVELKQGSLATYSFTVDSTSNPQYIFEILDSKVDTSTLKVTVQQSSSNASFQIFNPTSSYLELGPTDKVYFLQEAINGNYQIYFGDGVLGEKLTDGNIVNIAYISTAGSAGGLANTFTLMDNIGATLTKLTVQQQATQGTDKETIQSIKFQAPKAFAAQGRAVSKNDYITILQQNTLGIPFDAVSVWGGEENNPPVYGQVFISLKPTGAYDLTATQKQLILNQVIKPISVVTIEPVIVDPDYTYIQVTANVLYQPSQTNQTPGSLQTSIQNAVYNYSINNLNTFNSTFNSYEVLTAINNADPSIISSDFNINVQKKFYPTLGSSSTYTLNYNSPLVRGVFGSGIFSTPAIYVADPSNLSSNISGVYIEEVPTSTSSVASLSIINSGYNYLQTPSVVITGDGTGATANVTIINGSISSVEVTNIGFGYTSAAATVVPATGDQGQGASLLVNLQGQYGNLRSYYIDPLNGKVIVNQNVGTVDYFNGIITLTNFNPLQIDNVLGELTISAKPTTTLISSTLNRIITIDPYDPQAVIVGVTAKN